MKGDLSLKESVEKKVPNVLGKTTVQNGGTGCQRTLMNWANCGLGHMWNVDKVKCGLGQV